MVKPAMGSRSRRVFRRLCRASFMDVKRASIRDQHSVALLGSAKVVSAQGTPNGPALSINEQNKAKGDALVELDKPLELSPLSLVVLDGKRSAGGFVLRNCWLHDNFQRTLINGSPGGLIENNTLQNVGQGLAIQFEQVRLAQKTWIEEDANNESSTPHPPEARQRGTWQHLPRKSGPETEGGGESGIWHAGA